MIPSAQDNSLVMNTLGRIDSAVMDTPENLCFLVDLAQAKELVYKMNYVCLCSRIHTSIVYSLQGC